MASTKIINVLKDDTFGEILELCKATPAEEVILILPKKSKFLSKEDHFVALSTEAKSDNKRISLMTASADTAELARKYGFEVLAERGIAPARSTQPVAKLAVADDDEDPEIHEDDIDAYEKDVIVPSDEQIGIAHEEEEDELDGVHVEDKDGNIIEEEKDELEDELEDEELEDKEDIEEEDDIDGKRDDLDEEFSVGNYGADGATASMGLSGQGGDYQIAMAAARMDGIVTPQGKADRVKIKTAAEKAVELDIRPSTAQEEKLRDIERVWQNEASLAGGDTKKSFWSDFTPKGIMAKRSTPSHNVLKRRWSPKIIGGFAAIFLGVIATLFFVATSSAKVTVRPIKQDLDVRIKVSVSDSFASVDPTFIKIPGQLFSIDKSVSQDFQATGQKETVQKARGKIKVFNTYSTAPQTLIATTRFEANGLIFRTLRTITVPGLSGAMPGMVEVEVIADKAGDAYNIPAAKFVLPAFREKGDTQRYEKFYAQSTDPMRGGVSGLAKIVTQADYDKAKEAIVKKLTEETQAALQSQASGLTLIEASGASTPEITSTSNVEQAADVFTVTASGKVKMMGFKKEDLQDLLKQYIDQKYHLTVFPDKLAIQQEKSAFDDAKGILELRVTTTGDGYGKVDKDKILGDIAGKNEQEIRSYFETAEGIGKTTAVLPRLRNMPADPSKIKFEVIYE
jgi:hypothetical protein